MSRWWEISEKVWPACAKIAEQGYWTGDSSPSDFNRSFVDEKRGSVGTPKHDKSPETASVGAATIQRIFHEFTELSYSAQQIAKRLSK